MLRGECGIFKAAVEFQEGLLTLPLGPTLPLRPMAQEELGWWWGTWVAEITSQCMLLRLHRHFNVFFLPGLFDLLMSAHPSYWLVTGKPPLKLLLTWKMWWHATN